MKQDQPKYNPQDPDNIVWAQDVRRFRDHLVVTIQGNARVSERTRQSAVEMIDTGIRLLGVEENK